jgi:hypothetical protein
MSDMQGLRAQLRENRSISAPRVTVTADGTGGGLLFWIMAAVAGAIAFAVVLLGPRFFTAQRTASLPAFQEAQRPAPAEPAPVQAAPQQQGAPAPQASVAAAPVAPAPAQAAAPQAPAPAQAMPPAQQSRYANKTPEDVVRTVDAVCEQRSQSVRMGGQPQRPAARTASAKPPGSDEGGGHKITAADEKLHCFLTEAVPRFCAPNQKRKAAADAINYFKGIEYTNAAAKMAAKVHGTASVLNPAEIDPGVVDALEALIRGGYLTKAQRDEVGASVPREIRDRLARVVANVAPCPKPPWWAQFF